MLRTRKYDWRRFKRDLGEYRFLPHGIRNVYLQRGKLGQPNQRDMHGHARHERQLQQCRHERLRSGYVSRRSRYGDPVEMELRRQLRWHHSGVLPN